MRWPLVAALLITVTSFHSPHPRTTSTNRAEVVRIQAHLTRAEAFAASRNLSGLTAAQRRARARHLRVLAAYRERGVFPENRDLPFLTPVFVDARGVHCAVGHLLAIDGECALVARIAATRNLARIAELADEPELIAWLDRNGLTVEETARIQPEYGPPPPPHEAYRKTALASAFIAGTGLFVNLQQGATTAERERRAAYGAVVGGIAVATGAIGLLQDLDAEANFCAMVGVVAGVSAIGRSFHNRSGSVEDGATISFVPTLERRGLALIRASF